MQANQLRVGKSILVNGELFTVLEASHRAPGNKRAFVQVSMRSLVSGKIIQQKFSSNDHVEDAPLDARKAQYLYKDEVGYHVMDQADYETYTLGEDLVGDYKNFLRENDEIKILMFDNKPVSVELPPKVALEVAEAPEWVRGDSVSNNMKPVTLETGMKIMVPIFIKQGTKIFVDTRSGEYISRE